MAWYSETKQTVRGVSRLLLAGVAGCVINTGVSLGSVGGQAYAQAPAPILLEHVRLFDGTGQAEQEDMAVLVQGARIVSVGHTGHLAAPKGVKRIDLSGKTLIPGLITDHSHVGLVSGTLSGLRILQHPSLKRHWTSMNAMG